MGKQLFEQTGLIPRSIIRTFDRFKKQLITESETIVIDEFKASRYQVIVSLNCLINLIFIPFLVNFLIKFLFLFPLSEYFWNTYQTDIFLNSYQEEKAFTELQKFEDILFFDFLVNKNFDQIETKVWPDYSIGNTFSSITAFNNVTKHSDNLTTTKVHLIRLPKSSSSTNFNWLTYEKETQNKFFSQPLEIKRSRNIFIPTEKEKIQIVPKKFFHCLATNLVNNQNRLEKGNFFELNEFQNRNTTETKANYFEKVFNEKIFEKTKQLANLYNKQSIVALTNFFGDFITFGTIILLLNFLKSQIIILKYFLMESIYSLSDTTKSFLLILGTDLLVGFHSPRGWEIILELFLHHFGLPENQDFIFLFVATFPVLLDTVFKYWIFRYLNQISPSTVATYHNMIE
jgi:CemA family